MRTPTDHLSGETIIISENDRKNKNKKTKISVHSLKSIQQMEKHLFKSIKFQ